MAVELTVDRSAAEYATSSKCLAYLDPGAMKREGLIEGELIRIRTERGRTVLARAAAVRDPDGANNNNIRLDRFLRQAAKVRLNESVEVEKFPALPVRKVVLLPAIDVRTAHNLKEHLMATLVENRTPVAPGAVLYVNFPHSNAGSVYIVHKVEDLPGFVTEETEIQVDPPEAHTVEGAFDVTFEDVGGLENQIRLVRELVQLPLQIPYVYRQLGINPPRGIIFYGPPGTGKTHVAKAVAGEVQARFYYINGPDVIGTLYGETEGNLRRIFNEAAHHAPSVIMIDELDALAPKRGETGAHSDTRMVTQLLSLLDGLKKIEGVVVIGTTNRIESIDLALRRPGRFDREIFFGPPDTAGRLDILQIHTREMPLAGETLDYLPAVASATHGFVGADLMELTREAGLEALRRETAPLKDHLAAFHYEAADIVVQKCDFDAALAWVHPSAMREVLVTVGRVGWDEVGGLTQVKARLQALIQAPMQNRGVFKAMGVVPAKGIILYGPPGTGKTLLAQAVASHCGVNFIPLEGPEVFTKWLGESEEAVRHIFRVARQAAPAIVFFDQLDALAPVRGLDRESKTTERVVNQLLAELDGVEPLSDIMVLAATNRLDLIDASVLRPGRFGTHVYVPLPRADERAQILRIHLRGARLAPDSGLEDVTEYLVPRTEGFSGAELRSLCEEAKFAALVEAGFQVQALRLDHLAHALESISKVRDSYRNRARGPSGGQEVSDTLK